MKDGLNKRNTSSSLADSAYQSTINLVFETKSLIGWAFVLTISIYLNSQTPTEVVGGGNFCCGTLNGI